MTLDDADPMAQVRGMGFLSFLPDRGVVADAERGHWADRWLPVAARPYARLMRLERPIGWRLLLLPCWWAVALAAHHAGRAPDPVLLVLFLIGAVAMRGAGCTWNDITDRDLDGKVARTASRPIPSGQVSVRQAVAFMALQALVGLVVLLQFNRATILLAFASLAIVAVYPFMKRVTDWPQLVLGLAFNWGALVGWTAVTGGLAAPALALYLGGIAFTIGYDTIYACQDKDDDALIGVRSTARLFGRFTVHAVAALYALAVVLFAVALALNGSGLPAYIGLAAFGLHLAWQIARLDPDNGDRCLMLMRSNWPAGLLFFVGLIADAIMATLRA